MNARREVLAARWVADLEAEKFWVETIDRLLDLYLKESIDE